MEDDGGDNSLFFRRGDSYNRNNKIIIVAITSLSLVVAFLTVLHIYARCVLRREARRRAALRHLRFNIAADQVPSRMGLDPAVIASLPILVFKRAGEQGRDDDDTGVLKECTVCLCIFKDGERIRMLPNCNHRFHAECIDKWLGSTSTCPICRTKAEPRPIIPEAREPMVAAPSIMARLPPEVVSSITLGLEGTSDDSLQPSAAKVGGSNSRLGSFHKIFNRERSSTWRVQSCGEDVVDDDVLHV